MLRTVLLEQHRLGGSQGLKLFVGESESDESFIKPEDYGLPLSSLQLPRLGLGMAALGRPGYINLGHSSDIADRSVEAMRNDANISGTFNAVSIGFTVFQLFTILLHCSQNNRTIGP